jgi:predicted PurR-regulated permease PerM
MAGWRLFLWVVVVVALLAFLWAVRAVLLPFLLAWLIAVLLEPMVKGLKKMGLPRPAAVFAITIVFFGAVGGVFAWLAPQVSRQVNEVRVAIQGLTRQLAEESADDNPFVRWNPAVRAKPEGPLGQVDEYLATYRGTLEQFGLPTTRRALTAEYVDPYRENISSGLTSAFNSFIAGVGAAASSLILLAFTPLFAIFLMMDLEMFRTRLSSWIPPGIRKSATQLLDDVGDVLQGYIRGVTINIAIYSTVMAVVLTIMGAPYSYLFALVAGALYLIPNIGGLISMTVLFLVTGFTGTRSNAFLTMPNAWAFAAVLALVFTIITMTWDLVVTPRVVGKAVKLHPFVGMFVVFCGGALFGLIGMMFAYPVAGVIKLMLERVLNITNKPVKTSLGLPARPLRHKGETSAH